MFSKWDQFKAPVAYFGKNSFFQKKAVRDRQPKSAEPHSESIL